MAAINPLGRELVLKIVFYGPGLGGKTTTLQHIHDAAKPEHRGKMVSLATAVDRTLYFDFLPLRVPKTRGMSVRLQLFTVPGQVYYNSTRKLVLTGADGIVFVADSQSARIDANLESLENLQDNLREQKRELGTVPHVIQYNKRDIAGVSSLDELEATLNLYRAPHVGTVATTGDGVFRALSAITRAVVAAFNESLPERGEARETSLVAAEDGIAAAIRGADEAAPSTRAVSVVRENVLDPGSPPHITGFPEQAAQASSDRPNPPRAEAQAPTSPTRPAPSGLEPGNTLAAAPNDDAQRTSRPRGAAALFSFQALWGEGEREMVRDAETAIALHDGARATDLLDQLAARVLASSAALVGTSDAPRDAALAPILLGVSGSRYLAFRSLVRDARSGIEPDERAVLAAYAFVLELRLARGRLAL